jgi:hypothetical protein
MAVEVGALTRTGTGCRDTEQRARECEDMRCDEAEQVQLAREKRAYPAIANPKAITPSAIAAGTITGSSSAANPSGIRTPV